MLLRDSVPAAVALKARKLKGESVVVAMLLSRMEVTFCTSRFIHS